MAVLLILALSTRVFIAASVTLPTQISLGNGETGVGQAWDNGRDMAELRKNMADSRQRFLCMAFGWWCSYCTDCSGIFSLALLLRVGLLHKLVRCIPVMFYQ